MMLKMAKPMLLLYSLTARKTKKAILTAEKDIEILSEELNSATNQFDENYEALSPKASCYVYQRGYKHSCFSFDK